MALPERSDLPEIQRQLLAAEYKAWHAVVMANSEVIDDPAGPPTEREFSFGVDRHEDKSSQVTVDQVEIRLLRENLPLEEFMGIEDPRFTPSQEGERWLYMYVTPEDPYRSRVGYFEDNGHRFYQIERLEVFLSSLGRGYQQTSWDQILEPDIHLVRKPAVAYLKHLPPDEAVTKFDHELDIEEVLIEPFQPLRGQTLERLAFFRSAMKSGEVIPGYHS